MNGDGGKDDDSDDDDSDGDDSDDDDAPPSHLLSCRTVAPPMFDWNRSRGVVGGGGGRAEAGVKSGAVGPM